MNCHLISQLVDTKNHLITKIKRNDLGIGIFLDLPHRIIRKRLIPMQKVNMERLIYTESALLPTKQLPHRIIRKQLISIQNVNISTASTLLPLLLRKSRYILAHLKNETIFLLVDQQLPLTYQQGKTTFTILSFSRF